jgi:hypothetical protein
MSESLAGDLGIDLSAMDDSAEGWSYSLDVPAPTGVRIGGMSLRFDGVKSKVMFRPEWLFGTMHNDANLPSTVLRHYQVVFDYPTMELTIAEPGILRHRGQRTDAPVHPENGIVQVDAMVDGETLSFALDNGASYSFASGNVLERISERNPDWPRTTGAVGCANIWGWWPMEESWPVVRLQGLQWGPVDLAGVGMVGLPDMFPGETDLGTWYSQKAARPVVGFLGPNAFKSLRIEIDYPNEEIWFELVGEVDTHDMDIIGLTLRPQPDGSYLVLGVSSRDESSAVTEVKPGDLLRKVDGLEVTCATMGTVFDALRGAPGDVRTLVLEREGEPLTVDAVVERHL